MVILTKIYDLVFLVWLCSLQPICQVILVVILVLSSCMSDYCFIFIVVIFLLFLCLRCQFFLKLRVAKSEIFVSFNTLGVTFLHLNHDSRCKAFTILKYYEREFGIILISLSFDISTLHAHCGKDNVRIDIQREKFVRIVICRPF